jgi:hypothetical protein
LYKGHEKWERFFDSVQILVKFTYKVVDEETPGTLQQIDFLNDIDLLVSSCDSEPSPNFL